MTRKKLKKLKDAFIKADGKQKLEIASQIVESFSKETIFLKIKRFFRRCLGLKEKYHIEYLPYREMETRRMHLNPKQKKELEANIKKLFEER